MGIVHSGFQHATHHTRDVVNNYMHTYKIQEACFKLATHLMWQKEDLEFDEMKQNLKELNVISDKLFEISTNDLDLFDDSDEKNKRIELIAKSIHYINSVHAIPPLRDNYHWFEYTLYALLEIADPQSGIKYKSPEFDFLLDMKNGLDESISHSKEESEE